MAVELDLQIASSATGIPDEASFRQWLDAVLPAEEPVELTIRVVDRDESAMLNERYRNKVGPTNVLSFPADIPPELDLPLLGDLVICAPLVRDEAQQQHKDLEAHWAHLVIHGVLHLLGFDHDSDEEAQEMESREVMLLSQLGITDPYN